MRRPHARRSAGPCRLVGLVVPAQLLCSWAHRIAGANAVLRVVRAHAEVVAPAFKGLDFFEKTNAKHRTASRGERCFACTPTAVPQIDPRDFRLTASRRQPTSTIPKRPTSFAHTHLRMLRIVIVLRERRRVRSRRSRHDSQREQVGGEDAHRRPGRSFALRDGGALRGASRAADLQRWLLLRPLPLRRLRAEHGGPQRAEQPGRNGAVAELVSPLLAALAVAAAARALCGGPKGRYRAERAGGALEYSEPPTLEEGHLGSYCRSGRKGNLSSEAVAAVRALTSEVAAEVDKLVEPRAVRVPAAWRR